MERKLPNTSIDAFRSVTPKMLAKHYQMILDALKMINTGNYEDISIHLGLTDKVKVARRLNEMCGLELIHKTGITKPTSTGRGANVYAIRTPDTIVPIIENHYREGVTTASDYAAELIAKTKQQQLIQKDLFENN
jgi:hypothetical protein